MLLIVQFLESSTPCRCVVTGVALESADNITRTLNQQLQTLSRVCVPVWYQCEVVWQV